MKNSRGALRALLYGAIVILLIVFASQVDWRGAAAAARGADVRLLALAMAVNLASLALKGARWWVFLRALGVRSIGLVLRATFAGASLNNLLVAQGGEGARVLIVSRAGGISSAGVLAALATERVLDAVTYLMLLVGAVWMLDTPPMIARWRTMATAALAVIVVAVLLLPVIGRNDGGRSKPAVVLPLRPTALARLRAYGGRFARGVAIVATPARLLAGIVLSLGAWLLQVATYHLVALAVHIPLRISGSLVALLVVGVSFLVRATPGNVGVFQVAYALAVRSFGVAQGPAVAVALLIQVIQVIPTMIVGGAVSPGLRGKAKN